MATNGKLVQPVVKGVRYTLAHAPGLVRYGHKPALDLSRKPEVLEEIASQLRRFEEVCRYPPNLAFLGAIYPDDLRQFERPWFVRDGGAERRHPHGETIPEEELYGLIKVSDAFNMVWLEEGFTRQVRDALASHPLVQPADIERLGEGHPYSEIEEHLAGQAVPLWLRGGGIVGAVDGAREEGPALAAEVMLENLACKATATMALRSLIHDLRQDPNDVGYILNCGEEAVGDSYQRGGGNLAKAIGEMCDLANASGSDVKAFCTGPMHAMMMAATLVCSGVFRQVAVVGGGSLPKLGMNYQGHISAGQPILEDVLASVAVIIGADDGVSPILRLDSIGTHSIGAGSSLRNISRALVTEPLTKLGLAFREVDKYAIELQNPEITEPSGAGDVTERNYRLIGALAVQAHEIDRSDIPEFAETHGMPGFSSTQGHIASAVPFLGHAIDRLRDGRMSRAMFIAKGSLFLGRMTQMSDGLSFILEPNPNR